jgi:hypothetical protein
MQHCVRTRVPSGDAVEWMPVHREERRVTDTSNLRVLGWGRLSQSRLSVALSGLSWLSLGVLRSWDGNFRRLALVRH